jgi:hypothetical protein
MMKKHATAMFGGLVCLSILASPSWGRTLNGFDLSNASIPPRDIVAGGPPRDGIPSIDDPKFLPADRAGFLADEDRVLGIDINGQAKAYPISILNWHEVVNDRNGSQHFVVTFCPLCGTGMVFASNVGEGALVFGVSGLLYNSDVLLFDRNSESLWSQILGEAVSGPLKGAPLPQLPARHTSWAAWRAEHPETLVLSTDTGFRRDYARSPYRGYERSPRLYFSVANRAPRDYHPKAWVMGVDIGGTRKAYPFEELQALGKDRFEDELNGTRLIVHWDEAANSAHVTDVDGNELPSTIGFWFAWYAFFPETAVFKAE